LHRKIQQKLEKEKFDLIYVYSSSMAQYVEDVTGVKKVIDLADADSHKWLQYAQQIKTPMRFIYHLEYRRLCEYERYLVDNFDHSIAISKDEKKLFETYIEAAKSKMSVVPNGVNLEYFSPSENGYNPCNIIFVGAMDYFANVDAVVYFERKVLPLIEQEVPQVKFYIVGTHPVGAVRALHREEKVIVTGFVDDVREYLQNCSVCVIPLRIARGIQNKILQSMAAGVPVVTTSKGNEGINAVVGESIMVEDDPAAFARRVIDLVKSSELRVQVARLAREFVETNFLWKTNLEKFERILTTTYES
jgi:sugar transferase (PEP-CTERM/EpsH1 system associated)